ncbi:MAG: endoglucanase [Gaiellaceae bacterium]|nr:endoglucanase [Gaiellaceae bacterium]
MALPWLSRRGQQIVDESGTPVLLRGVGIGNWLLPEGYMWRFADNTATSPRQIEAVVESLVGAEQAERFWHEFRERYFTEEDVAAIAGYGFNSIRFAINSRIVLDEAGAFREDGFALIERAVQWCRDHGLYVILDLHGAPGGQTGANIDDSLGWPDLFTDRRNEELTIALWFELARRYRDDPTIAMYDLLNEPIPGDHRAQYTRPLAKLYKELIAVIREVDKRHLITLEGTNWSNDWSMFTELWDDQLVLQFHKYWNAPDQASIQTYLDVREQLDVPIWLGETGENNTDWFQGNFGLADSLGIGWNFWPWKKLDTENSPASIRKPHDWELVQAAAAGGEKPEPEVAQRILDEYLENIPYAACEHRVEVVNALFRRAPVRLAPEHASRAGGARRAGAVEGFHEADAVTVGFVDTERSGAIDWANTGKGAPQESERLEVRLEAGEWVAYDVELAEPGALTASVSGVASADARVTIAIDGTEADTTDPGEALTAARSGELTVGRHEVRVSVTAGSLALRALDVR